MSTVLKPELSNKSKWHLSKERYYELKHFCLQYPEWKNKLLELTYVTYPQQLCFIDSKGNYCNPVEKTVVDRETYLNYIDMVDKAANQAEPDLAIYILQAVAYRRSFTYLQTVMRIPCCKDVFYDRYRKFFWILDQLR